MEPSINPSLSLFLTLWFYSVATSSAALSFSNHVIPQKTNLRSEQPNNVITCVYLKGSQANIDSYNNSEYDRIDHRCQTFAEYEEDGQSEMVYELPDYQAHLWHICFGNRGSQDPPSSLKSRRFRSSGRGT